MRLAHSQRLAEKNKHIVLPEELTAALTSPTFHDLSRYLLQPQSTSALIESFNHPEIFRQSITNFADIVALTQTFPHRQQALVARVLTDDALFKKILTAEAANPIVILTYFHAQSDDFLTKAFSDPELRHDLIRNHLLDLIEAYPLRQDEIADRIFADPDLFKALLATKMDLADVFPEHTTKIEQLTKIYTQPITAVFESAIHTGDVDLILLMSSLLEGKKLNTPQDRILRNTLMSLINQYLAHTHVKDENLTAALVALQKNLAALPLPSLLSTTTLFVQRTNLPESSEEMNKPEQTDNLGKYFKL